MTWVMLFCYPLMAAGGQCPDRSVSGQRIAGNIRQHYPQWLVRSDRFLLVVANIINLGAMGEATRRLLGGPAHLCAVGCALVEEFFHE
jgi:hypothetical protein